MLFCFLFSLLYKNSVTYNTKATLISVEDFGFAANGKSETRFSDYLNSPNLFLVIFNHSEQKSYLKQRYPSNNATYLCKNPDNVIHFVNITNKSGIYQFTIPSDDVYYYKLVECGNATSIKVKFTNLFTNPNTHLDTRWIGILRAKSVMLVIFCVILCYWFINWFQHFKVQIWIHYLFTITFIFAVLLDVTRIFEFRELDKQDSAPFLTPLRIVIEVIGAMTALTALLLASKGWCIIRDEISLKEMILSILYSVVFYVLITIPQYVYLGFFELPVFLVSLVFVGLYVRELIISINDASMHILAHMLAISNENINPQTTPVYQKHLMYQYFEYAVIGGCTLVLVKICVLMFVEIPLWLSETISDGIEIILLLTIEVIFRLRDSATAPTGDYTFVTNDEENIRNNNRNNHDIEGMLLEDIEAVDQNALVGKGGRQWEAGMPLPPMPRLLRSRTIRDDDEEKKGVDNDEERKLKQPTVVITSPDGTEAITAQIEKNEDEE